MFSFCLLSYLLIKGMALRYIAPEMRCSALYSAAWTNQLVSPAWQKKFQMAVPHLISRRYAAVIGVVEVAGHALKLAVLGRHPEIGAASIKNDHEALGRRSDGDLAKVLHCSRLVRLAGVLRV
jgi:hypothetical protein